MKAEVMTKEHPLWDVFLKKLGDRLARYPCKAGRHKGNAISVLLEMGLSANEVNKSVEYFEHNGGYCDCEILLNVE